MGGKTKKKEMEMLSSYGKKIFKRNVGCQKLWNKWEVIKEKKDKGWGWRKQEDEKGNFKFSATERIFSPCIKGCLRYIFNLNPFMQFKNFPGQIKSFYFSNQIII